MNRSRILWGCYAVFIGVLLAGHLNSQLPRVFLPYELDYGEGIVLWQAQHILQKQHAYSSLDDAPHIVYHYPPLFHYASRLLAETGLEPLAAGRLVSLLSVYGVVCFAGLLVYGVTPRRWNRAARWMGASVVALFLYRHATLVWATVMRVDCLALFLVALGLYFFIRSPAGGRSEYIGFACFVLALYTKQTYIAAPVACLGIAWLTDPRAALRRLWFLATAGGAILLLFTWWTDGGFVRHLFLYTQYPYSFRKLYSLLVENTRDLSGILPLAFGALAITVGRSRSRWLSWIRPRLRHQRFRRALVTLCIYAVLAGCLSLTSGGQGSHLNYFLEWNLACTALAGLFVAWAFRKAKEPGPDCVIVVVCFGLLGVSALPAGPEALLHLVRPSLDQQRRAQKMAEFREVVSVVRRMPGPVVADDMVVLLAAGKEIPFEPIVVKFLAATGGWDETAIVEGIAEQRYSAIVFTMSRGEHYFSPAVVSAMRSAYRQAQQIGVYTIYLPAR